MDYIFTLFLYYPPLVSRVSGKRIEEKKGDVSRVVSEDLTKINVIRWFPADCLKFSKNIFTIEYFSSKSFQHIVIFYNRYYLTVAKSLICLSSPL